MPHFNITELIIVLLIVLVLFGAGRVARVGGELGAAVREFKNGLNAGEKPKTTEETTESKQS